MLPKPHIDENVEVNTDNLLQQSDKIFHVWKVHFNTSRETQVIIRKPFVSDGRTDRIMTICSHEIFFPGSIIFFKKCVEWWSCWLLYFLLNSATFRNWRRSGSVYWTSDKTVEYQRCGGINKLFVCWCFECEGPVYWIGSSKLNQFEV